MNEFALIFRMDILTEEAQPTDEQMQGYMENWMKWINSISSKGQLAAGGNHFLPTGALLKPQHLIEKGPYVVNHESVAGYILILANDIDDAITIARQCPILQGKGTSVEVRQTATPPAMKSIGG